MAKGSQRKQRRRTRTRSMQEELLTYPVGVLIRDKDRHIYYLSLAQLSAFRRTDLEVTSVQTQLDEQPGLLGLKNAWLMEGIGMKSGD